MSVPVRVADGTGVSDEVEAGDDVDVTEGVGVSVALEIDDVGVSLGAFVAVGVAQIVPQPPGHRTGQ